MKTLITGGSGWIGSQLVAWLEKEGDTVFNYDLKEGLDITDKKALENTFKKGDFDQVYHLAAQAFLGPGEQNVRKDLEINVGGMLNMLEILEEYDIPMVYTSSGAVYGISTDIPHKEETFFTPHSNYGCSKLAAENYLRKWVMSTNVKAKIIRFSSVYGPHRTHGPINIFLRKAKAGEDITVFGEGTQTRDMIFIDDALKALQLVMEKGGVGEIYNIGTGKETSVLDVAEIISKIYDVPIVHVDHALSQFDQPTSWYNVARLRRLGFIPRYGVEKGIKETIGRQQ